MSEMWPSERWQTSSYTSCESEELYLTSCGTYDLGIVPTLFSLNERLQDSASVYFQHLLCPVLWAAVSAQQQSQQDLKQAKRKPTHILLKAKYFDFGDVDKSVLKARGNSCTIKSGSLLFLKSLLVFHPAAAPGHRMRHLYKQRASGDIRHSLSLFLCCSWCVSSCSVLQHFSDKGSLIKAAPVTDGIHLYNLVFLKWFSQVSSCHRVSYTLMSIKNKTSLTRYILH